MPEKPPRVPPVPLVKAVDKVRTGLTRLQRSLTPGAVNAFELITGGAVAQTVFVATKLGIPDVLDGQPMRADEVARRVDANPDAVFRLMRALASYGVLRHRRDGTFTLTPTSKALRTGTPGSVRDFILWIGYPLRWEDWGHFMYSVQTGEPVVDKLRGMSFFEYLEKDSDIAAAFDKGMTAGSEFVIYAVLAAYDFSHFRTVVDVGGGQGRLLSKLLAKATGARGVLYDLPSVVEGAGAELESSGIAHRCEVVGGSFFDSVPAGGDAYLMKSILHDWPDVDALRILGNIREAMGPGGKLVLVELVLPERSWPGMAVVLDLEMLIALRGKERTRAEWSKLLEQSGFRLNRVVDTATPFSIIEAGPI